MIIKSNPPSGYADCNQADVDRPIQIVYLRILSFLSFDPQH